MDGIRQVAKARLGGGQEPDLAFLRGEQGEGERFRHGRAADASVGQPRNELKPGAPRQLGDRNCCVACLGRRSHLHSSDPCWATLADEVIDTLLAAACRKRFDSRLLLTARDRTSAPTIVDRMAISLSV